jgi:Asp-tRNA(Asn)/Glu-tRNA(Gln) amidotransferase A subunit family amidase
MLRAVNANRDNYDALRAVPIDRAVEPAFHFQPPLPAQPAGRATPHARITYARGSRQRAFDSIDELAFLSVTELAPLVEARRVSSRELTSLSLTRLKRHNPALNCIVTLTEELALAQAAAADREIAAGRYRGPLHGIPSGVKDLFATRGIRTTWGAKPYEAQVIDEDATVVQRLRDAGAVLVAKLTTGELAIGDLWFGGRTKNPWNPERGTGGSSAGVEQCDVFLAPSDSASVTLTNLTGHLALTVNAGFAGSLPVGLMITGRAWDEATVLAAGLAFERATSWHTQHPALA